MSEIWKFNITERTTELEAPIGTKWLHADYQRGRLCLWGIVTDPNSAARRIHRIRVVATGEEVNHLREMEHISTVQDESETFVWHVFCDNGLRT
jgi:hypothetical protein